MIYPFRKELKISYAYTLYDVIKYGLVNGLSPDSYTADYPKANSTIFKRSLFTQYGVDFPSNSLIPNKYIDETRIDLLNLLIERYWNEYVFVSDENMDDPMNILSYLDITMKTRQLLNRIIDVIEFTYPKYSVILTAYDETRTHLLDQLSKTIDGTDTRRDNDTPQDGGDYSDDSHTSFITQGVVNNTESWDSEPIIDRLDKIARLYQQVKRNWLDEFKDIFIEGGNFHEV